MMEIPGLSWWRQLLLYYIGQGPFKVFVLEYLRILARNKELEEAIKGSHGVLVETTQKTILQFELIQKLQGYSGALENRIKDLETQLRSVSTTFTTRLTKERI